MVNIQSIWDVNALVTVTSMETVAENRDMDELVFLYMCKQIVGELF